MQEWVIEMSVELRKPSKTDWLIAAVLIAAGTAVTVLSVSQIMATAGRQEIAQANPPLQASPPDEAKKDVPAESTPGGTRPTTPAPAPARPDPDAQKAGAQPALPPAPAEKIAPPIKDK
jgi:hypothetical protein